MFGTILENVTMDEVTRELDFTDASKTENTRGAYPIEFIPKHQREDLGPPPSTIIFPPPPMRSACCRQLRG